MGYKSSPERQVLIDQGLALIAKAEDENRSMTAKELGESRRLRDAVAEFDKQAMALAVEATHPLDATHDAPRATRQLAPGANGRRYADLFGPPQASAWKSNAEFLNAAMSGLHDDRLFSAAGSPLRISASMASTAVDSSGGFSVPEPLIQEMLDAALETEIVRPRADVRPMTSNTLKVAGWDAADSSATLYGGFAGAWVNEGAEINLEVPKMRRIELAAAKLAILTEVTNELVADGVAYGSELENALVKALSWYLDYGFLRGSGAGQPRGVLNDAALVTVNKEAGQPGATIYYENVTAMMNRLHPASLANAVWICNANTRAQLLQMSRVVGVGGGPVPVLTGSRDNYEILLIPAIFTEKLPGLGTVGDIMLVDFSQYVIGVRREMQLDRSQHVGFSRDTSHWRGIVRGDGQGKWGAAYTPKNGASLSWCVALQTRA